jgi:putative transposase
VTPQRQDVFDCIEMFYNPTRMHANNSMLTPDDYETRQRKMHKTGV